MEQLHGKVAVITGGNDGIGKQMAISLAKRGVRLALVARNQGRLDQMKTEIASDAVRTYVCDIGNASQRKAAVKKILADWGCVDILINNAGIIHRKQSLDEIEEGLIEEMVATNLTGLMQWTRLLLPELKKREEAIVINISSNAGVGAPQGLSVYAATKWGVRGFSNVLKEDLKDTSVRVSCVCQAGTRTGLFAKAEDRERPLEKYTEPADLAEIIAFMCSQPAKCWMHEVHVSYQ